MERNSFISNFKKLPLVFLVSVALFAIVQFAVANMDSFWHLIYLNSELSDYAIRLEAKLRTMPDNDERTTVFLIGTSQTEEGFDEEYLNRESEETNTVFYNLGFAGGKPINIYMIKDKLLAKKPDIVVEVLFVGCFYTNYPWSQMKDYFEPSILPHIIRHQGIETIREHGAEFTDSILGKISVFYKHREDIRRIITSAIVDIIKGESRTQPRMRLKENKPDSYFQNELKKYKSPRRRYYISQDTNLSKDLFTQFAEDVTAEGVKFIVISGPTHPLIKEVYDEELDYAFNNFIYNQSQSIGFIYLSKNDLPSFTEGDFIDFTHLNAGGRAKMSEFIEEYLETNNYIPR